MLLDIKNLHASVGDKGSEKIVVNGLNLQINAGEVHALMGPNGSGKSSFSKILAGHPDYTVSSGNIEYEINFKMKDLAGLSPDERAKEGIFLAYQYPVEIPGVSNFSFLQMAFNSVLEHQGAEPMPDDEFRNFVNKKLQLLQMKSDFLQRGVNVGFSGGEKKKNEILQMAVLSPRLAILDETDSGLDIDALRVVSDGINKLRNKSNAVILITHYQRLLDYIKPDFVHVFSDGKIIESGGPDLALKLEKEGYDWIQK